MTVHQQRQIEKIKKAILALGTMVEESLEGAMRAFETRDIPLATKIIENDSKIDQMEIDIEEECLHTLALYQPVAFDLRFVVSVLKINSDLERIADMAVNIAEQTRFITKEAQFDTSPFDLSGEAEKARVMLKKSLDALVNLDPKLAQEVLELDDDVDRVHRQMYLQVSSAIRKSPEKTNALINVLNISRYLERIADHAVNIAEDVVYMAHGDIMRHRWHKNSGEKPSDSR